MRKIGLMNGRRGRRVARSLRVVVVLGCLGVGVAMLGAESAAALPTCTDSWTGGSGSWFDASHWSTGTVPGTGDVACITAAGTYMVTIQAGGVAVDALELGGGSGTQTLALSADNACGDNVGSAGLHVIDSGSASTAASVGSNGVLQMTQDSSTCPANPPGNYDYLRVDSGALLNAGQIESDSGGVAASQVTARVLEASITNSGKLEVASNTSYVQPGAQSVTLDNTGAITIAGGDTLDVPPNNGATIINDTGGTITNNGGSGQLFVDANNVGFEQGAGTISSSGAVPADPAVVVNNTPIDYTGTGAGTIVSEGSVSLSGNVATDQALVVAATCPGGNPNNGGVAIPADLTNAGTITLTQTGSCNATASLATVGPCCSSHVTLTNTGTIDVEQGTSGSSGTFRGLYGDLDNQGLLKIAANTIYGEQSANPPTLDNTGTISIGNDSQLYVPPNNAATVIDDSGGTITNKGGSGELFVDAYNTFEQGAGTTSPSGPQPVDPVVVVNIATVKYTGSGASSVVARGNPVFLAGDVPATANLEIQCSGGASTLAHSPSFTNAGTIILSSDPSCAGGTTTLSVDSGSGNGTGTLTNTGTLDGTGAVSGTVENTTGDVIPGSATSPGSLSVGGNYMQGSGSRLTAQVDGTTAGTGFSQLAVQGSATLDGTLAVSLSSSFSPSPGQTFTVLTSAADQITGTFAQVMPSATSNGLPLTASYTASGATLRVQGTSIAAVSGDGQSAVVDTPFAQPLQVKVTGPAGPVAGAPVTFNAPTSGAGGIVPSATFPGGAALVTVQTDSDGIAASPPLTANTTFGTFTVTASTPGSTQPVIFTLTNEPAATGSGALLASPASVDLGYAALGSDLAPNSGGAYPITLSDTGTAPLQVSAVTIQGADPADFGASGGTTGQPPTLLLQSTPPPPGLDGCFFENTVAGGGVFGTQAAPAFTIAPGTSCWIYATFAPTALGARGGQLVIHSNDPNGPGVVDVRGTGVAYGGLVTGTVTAAATAAPVVGADVQLCPTRGASPRTCKTTTTDANGMYEFPGLPTGGQSYLVTVPAPDAALLGSSRTVTVGAAAGSGVLPQQVSRAQADFPLPANEPLPSQYSVTSPLGTFTKGVPRVLAAKPFGLTFPTIIPTKAPPGTTATFTVKVILTSLPGNRNSIGSAQAGFEADESIPISIAYDTLGLPVITAAAPAGNVNGIDVTQEADFIGAWLTQAQKRELASIGLPVCIFGPITLSPVPGRCVHSNANIFAAQGDVVGVTAPTFTVNTIIDQAANAILLSDPKAKRREVIAVLERVRHSPVAAYYLNLSLALESLTGAVPPIYPFGDLQLEIQQSYTDSTGKTLTADATTGLYVDPSGTVETTTGIPLAGARVVLEHADSRNGPFRAVPAGSVLMSTANRRNPDTTTVSGQFGWDVLPGYYRVLASRPGCHMPGHPRQRVARTGVLSVPPPASGLVIRLACPSLRRVATRTGLVLIPGHGSAPTILIAFVRPLHGDGVVSGAVTFRRGGRLIGIVPLRDDMAELILRPSRQSSVETSYSGDSHYAPSRAARH